MSADVDNESQTKSFSINSTDNCIGALICVSITMIITFTIAMLLGFYIIKPQDDFLNNIAKGKCTTIDYEAKYHICCNKESCQDSCECSYPSCSTLYDKKEKGMCCGDEDCCRFSDGYCVERGLQTCKMTCGKWWDIKATVRIEDLGKEVLLYTECERDPKCEQSFRRDWKACEECICYYNRDFNHGSKVSRTMPKHEYDYWVVITLIIIAGIIFTSCCIYGIITFFISIKYE